MGVNQDFGTEHNHIWQTVVKIIYNLLRKSFNLIFVGLVFGSEKTNCKTA